MRNKFKKRSTIAERFIKKLEKSKKNQQFLNVGFINYYLLLVLGGIYFMMSEISTSKK